jgi:predicted RNase H-like HicB family nuclease
MRYAVAVEPGDDKTAHGVAVPDLPGCFSAGDSFDEALDNAREAILMWLEDAFEKGEPLPRPSGIDALRAREEFAGWVWALVDVDLSALDDKAERVNITLPRRVLARLDAAAKAAGETRSGYIARLTLTA